MKIRHGTVCTESQLLKRFRQYEFPNSHSKEEEILSEAELQNIDTEVRAEVDQAIRFAEESAPPAAEELFTNIYADPIGEQE